MDKNNYCIIMAGGVGSRFWPLSRTSRPKQFLDILGTGKTLLQQTYERFLQVCPKGNIFIVTNIDYKELVFEQIPGIKAHQVLLEPFRRNTAPCIAYASHKIQKINQNARIVVAPSDHLILKKDEFLKVVKQGLAFVKDNDALLTLGIKPNRPETGYGYIQINSGVKNLNSTDFRKVKTFTEKPNLELARVFYESREFYWNSGIFFWSLHSIMKAFNLHLPEVDSLFREGINEYDTPGETDFIEKSYSECKNISIDYGVMEKADNVYVLCADFGWSDLGTWVSLYENSTKDEHGNVFVGDNIFPYNLKNCIVNVPKDKLVVLQGLEDYIIVESDNVLLVCKKQDEQEIKRFVNDVKIEKGDDFV